MKPVLHLLLWMLSLVIVCGGPACSLAWLITTNLHACMSELFNMGSAAIHEPFLTAITVTPYKAFPDPCEQA